MARRAIARDCAGIPLRFGTALPQRGELWLDEVRVPRPSTCIARAGAQFFDVGGADGKLGLVTRVAVKQMQVSPTTGSEPRNPPRATPGRLPSIGAVY